jgi:thiol:disulfide interchange protein DsbD
MSIRPVPAAALAAALVGAPAGAAAGPWAETPEARARLLSRFAAVAPAGGDAGLALEFELAPGWHVYWKNPGDAGYPPALAFEGGAIPAAALRFPPPERFELPGDLVAFGYAERVVHPVDAALAPVAGGSAPGRRALAARLDFLVCRESCIPRVVPLALELPVAAAPADDPEVAPAVELARARLPQPAPAGTAGRLVAAAGRELALELVLGDGSLRGAAPDLFFETHPLVALGRPQPLAAAPGPGFRVPLRPLDATRPLPDRLRFAWTATGFERAGLPVAFEGEIEVERPRAAQPAAWIRPAGVALAACAALVVLFTLARRTRGARSVDPQP